MAKRPQTNKTPAERKTKGSLRRSFCLREKRRASIYFLLWTIFSAFALAVVLLFGFSQQLLVMRTYKYEAMREISTKGEKIHEAILNGPPAAFGNNNYNGYLRFLSATYDVNIVILDSEGNLLFPKDTDLDPDLPEYKEQYDYTEETELLLKNLEKGDGKAVYEGDGEYVYGAKVRFLGDSEMYLHIGKSLRLMETALGHMRGRTVLLAVFMFILSFAVSSAVAGWLVNPLAEMTKKADRFLDTFLKICYNNL